MSSALASAPHLNGTSIVSPDASREAEFLDRLLQIRDEVFGSKHARIKLPPKVLEQIAPRPTQQTPLFPSRPTTNGTPNYGPPNGSHSSQPLPPRPESSLQHYHPPSGYSSPAQNAQRPFTAKSTSSGIDPVLLTKSDHLIRAELQLKRQQIERALKDQFDKRGREKDHHNIEESQLDVEALLAKAHELVKPVSGLQITANQSEASESFDENSYYSSQAYSWSSEEVDPNRAANGADTAVPLTSQAKDSAPDAQLTTVKPNARAEPKSHQVDTSLIDVDEEPYEPADDIEIYEPEPAQVLDEQEESDYSPPPADVSSSGQNKVRGHERGHGGMNGSSRRHSPLGHPTPIQNARKRRREERREEKREEKRRQQANKRVVRSPDPVIKEEPQSPPPFASYSDPQPNKRRALQPLDDNAEIVSPRGGRQQPIYYREQEFSSRASHQYDEPTSPTVVRMPQRRQVDDQDLRRVASLQYARRPMSPIAAEPLSYAPVETRHVRAASHAYVDRPMEPVYRELPPRASVAPRYIRERSRSPVHEYAPGGHSPVMMAPPRRHIVVDQYGQKFYASPADIRESVAPSSRRVDAEPYYERAVTREPTMRVATRPDLYEEEDAQRMPPPPRRYVDTSDAEVIETRPFRQRELSHRPLDVEYVPREVVERRPMVQYEEMGPPREYIPSRAYSVRPEIVRREAPTEYAPARHESIAPEGYVRVATAPRYRQVSVVQDIGYDDRRYAFASPSQPRRYVEEGAERPMEVAQEAFPVEPRRTSYRY